MVDQVLALELKTPSQFMAAFSPATIMEALAEHPTRRAHILEKTVGIRPKVGLKKSPASSGEDLKIALDEGETDAATVLELFEPDDRIRFLETPALWSFVVDPRYWSVPAHPDDVERVKAFTAFILSTAMEQTLITGPEIIRAISVQTLVQHLPRDTVAAVIEASIADKDAITESSLLEQVTLETICAHVPMNTLWEWVIGAKIAAPHGFASDNEPLFDEREAHPDAQPAEVTVILDPSETQPNGQVPAKEVTRASE